MLIPSSVGSAFLDITASTAKALTALKILATEGLAILKPLGMPIDVKVNSAALAKLEGSLPKIEAELKLLSTPVNLQIASTPLVNLERLATETSATLKTLSRPVVVPVQAAGVSAVQAQIGGLFTGLSAEAKTSAAASAQWWSMALKEQAAEAKTTAAVQGTAAREAAQAAQVASREAAAAAKLAATAQVQAAREGATAAETYAREQAETVTAMQVRIQAAVRLSSEESALSAKRSASAFVQAAAEEKAALDAQTLANRQALDGVALAYQRVRTAADKAFAQASGWTQQRDAAIQYQAGMKGVEAELDRVTQRAGLTEKELTRLSALQARIAREQATLEGKVNTLGISGNLQNALKSLGGLAPLLSLIPGPLGMISLGFTTLSGSLGAAGGAAEGLMARLGPVLLIAAPLVAVGAAVLGVGKAIADGIHNAADLEQQLAMVGTTAHLTHDQVMGFDQAMTALSSTLPITKDQLNEIALGAARLGVHGQTDLVQFTKAMAQMAVIMREPSGAMTNLTETSQELVKFLRATDTDGVKPFNQRLNETVRTLVALKTSVGSTIPEILNMASYFASFAKETHFTEAGILAISAALIGTGAKAQAAGHAIVDLDLHMQKAADEGGKAAGNWSKLLGVTVSKFDDMVHHSPEQAILLLSQRIDGAIKAGVPLPVLLESIDAKGKRLIQTVTEMAAGHRTLAQALAIAITAEEDKKRLDDMVAESTNNYKDKTTELKNSLHAASQAIGMQFLPMLEQAVNWLHNNREAIGQVAAGVVLFGQTLVGIGQVAIGFGETIAAPFIGLVVTVRSAVSETKTAVAQMVADLKTMLGDLGDAWTKFLHGDLSGAAASLAVAGQAGINSVGHAGQAASTVAMSYSNTTMPLLQTANNTIGAGFSRIGDNLPGTDAWNKTAKEATGSFKLLNDQMTATTKVAATQLDPALAALGSTAQKLSDKQLAALIVQAQKLQDAFDKAQPGTVAYIHAKDALDAFRKSSEGAASALDSLGSKRGSPITVADINTLNDYKASLKGMTMQQLESERATQTSLGDKAKLRAVLTAEAELTRQQAAESKKLATQLASETATRTTLVAAIRQHIAAFQLQADAGKVTAASQLAFNQQMDRYQAQLQKLPSELQGGTQALFDQAKAISDSTAGQVKAASVHQTTGIELIKLRDALKGATVETLKLKLADAEASMDRGRSTLIHQLLNKALADQAAASKKAAAEAKKQADEAKRQGETAEHLNTQITDLNAKFQLQTEQHKVTEQSALHFEQALGKLRDKVNDLPPALQGSLKSLLDQGDALQKTGKAAADTAVQQAAYAVRLKALKQEVDGLTLSELVGYRARLVSNGADQTKLDLLDKQIAKLQQAHDAGEALLGQSQATTQQASTDSTINTYAEKKQEAGQNLAQLLQIEKDYGSQVLAVKNAQARKEADAQSLKTAAEFDKAILAASRDTELQTQLRAQKVFALAAIETGYSNTQQANTTAQNQALQSAQRSFDSAVLTQDWAHRKLLLQDAVQGAADSFAQAENDQKDQLAVADLTVQQKLDILTASGPKLAQAKRDQVLAQRQAEIDSENASFADATMAATDQGLSLEKVKADHLTRLTDIDHQYGDGLKKDGAVLATYLLTQQKDLASAQTAVTKAAAAQQKIDDEAVAAGKKQAAQAADTLVKALATQDRASRRLQLQEALKSAQDATAVQENAQRDELTADDLTAQGKLAIIEKYKPLLAAAKVSEINASRAAELDAEKATYADEKQAATEQGLSLEIVEKDHAARLSAISREYGDGQKLQGKALSDYLAQLRKDELAAQTQAVKQTAADLKQQSADNKQAVETIIQDALAGLSTLDGQQRQTLRQTFMGLRDTYALIGPAGEAAVQQLDKAITQVDQLGDKVRAAAAKLIADPAKVTGELHTGLAKIGTPDGAGEARDQAVATFATLRKTYSDGIDEITLKLKEFEGHPLTLDEVKTKAGLEATVTLFTGFLAQIDGKATAAGNKAAAAFTDAASDAEQSANLELSKSQKAAGLITDAGYQQALQSYATYMHSRLTRFQVGTKEYSQAQIEAFKADQAAIQNNQSKLDAQATAALAKAKQLAASITKNGGDGTSVYEAGLKVGLAYWQGRLKALTGTDEQTQAEKAAIQSTIDQLGQEIEGLVHDSPLTRALDEASKLLGSLNLVADLSNLGPSIAAVQAQIQVDKQLGDASLSAIQAHESLVSTLLSSKTTDQVGTVILGSLDSLSAYFKAGGGSKGILAGASAFVGALGDVFKTGDENVDRVTTAFVQGVQGVIGALAKGDWVGAAIAAVATVVSTILNIIQGAARSLAKSKQDIENATKDIKFFDLGKYAVTETYRGGFLGLQKLSRSIIDQTAIDIAKSLGDAIYQGISTGMLDGIKAGKMSFADLGIDLKKTLGTQILQGLIDGFLKGAVMQAALQPFLDAYITAMKAGDAKGLAAAAEGIQNAAVKANAQLQAFYQNVLVPTATSLGVFGTSGTAPVATPAPAPGSNLQPISSTAVAALPSAQSQLGINPATAAGVSVTTASLDQLNSTLLTVGPQIAGGGSDIRSGGAANLQAAAMNVAAANQIGRLLSQASGPNWANSNRQS
ncbi:hypothetical protein GCM10022631_29520 [Deinococcus rubellus]|uniref:Phage tail tape measure protein n=1 Tax=Deinococcus rubellus TaxID=1889240 RepID=A0ABY5YHN2_9DEIO|nr:hypothetical protein [Deinococcus rubellus]UWX64201.1 hypothetical protein N0D28_00535 [Deinococcus rubellus]